MVVLEFDFVTHFLPNEIEKKLHKSRDEKHVKRR